MTELIIGLTVGSSFGVVIAGCCSAAKASDTAEDDRAQIAYLTNLQQNRFGRHPDDTGCREPKSTLRLVK